MRSDLMKNAERSGDPGTFVLQNPRMLKVDLAGTSGHFFARQGSMVAYQGDVDFAYQGSGGVGKFFKKAFTGEGMSLMKVSGSGDVFLARDADEIFLLELEDESVTVSGSNVLAFDSSLSWDINRVEGASMLSGGLFNTTFTGRGVLAVTIYGTPVVLTWTPPRTSTCRARCCGRPACTRRSARPRRWAPRSAAVPVRHISCVSPETGIVVVQASEGHPVPKP